MRAHRNGVRHVMRRTDKEKGRPENRGVTEGCQGRAILAVGPKIRFRRQMPEVGATWDEPHPGLRGHRLEATQSRSKALILGIARPFSNVEAVDKQDVADVCRITFAV